MFQALCKRRNVAIRYQRYASAMTAAAVYNVNRGADDPAVSAFDFVRSEKSAIRIERKRHAEQYIKQLIGTMPQSSTPAQFQDARRFGISYLVTQGFTGAEELFNECWPSLKPVEEMN